jgi:hypothetical protein
MLRSINLAQSYGHLNWIDLIFEMIIQRNVFHLSKIQVVKNHIGFHNKNSGIIAREVCE